MYKLYTEIEMPLIYSLWHMEQEGILVKRDKLKRIRRCLKGWHKETGNRDLYRNR